MGAQLRKCGWDVAEAHLLKLPRIAIGLPSYRMPRSRSGMATTTLHINDPSTSSNGRRPTEAYRPMVWSSSAESGRQSARATHSAELRMPMQLNSKVK